MSTALAWLMLAVASLALGASAAQGATATGWTPYDRPATYGVVVDKSVPITMPDGVVLRANVYRPDKPGRYPVLLFQNVYGNNGVPQNTGGASDPYLVQRGYVQVVVDVRGSGQSQGTWNPFSEQEQRDGYNLVEWAAGQSWSDGKVATAGPSYLAIDQMLTDGERPPHLRAAFPIVPMGDSYRDMVMTGGSTDTSFIPAWLGIVAAGSVQGPPSGADPAQDPGTLASHLTGVATAGSQFVVDPLTGGDMAFDGPFYALRSPIEVADSIDVPTFIVGKLQDLFQRGEPLLYERIKQHAPARLLIEPGFHTSADAFPADGVPSLHQIELRWFDHWLKGIDTHVDRIPRVTQYELMDGHFHTQADWPNPRLHPERLYLRGGKALRPAAPFPGETPQTFLQQPVSGICTLSTDQWTGGAGGKLPCTDNTNGAVDGTLGDAVYTTAPVRRALHLDGPILVELWLTTTARDAPVTVRVSDVGPDGTVTELTDGWGSAGFRAIDRSRSRFVDGRLLQPWHPYTRASMLPVTPGEPMALPIEVFPTNALIRPGHALRITVSPSDFPHQAPPLPQLANALGGRDAVLTDPSHPSYVELPAVGTTCTVGPKARLRGGRSHRRHKRRSPAVRSGAACRSLPVPHLLRGSR